METGKQFFIYCHGFNPESLEGEAPRVSLLPYRSIKPFTPDNRRCVLEFLLHFCMGIANYGVNRAEKKEIKKQNTDKKASEESPNKSFNSRKRSKIAEDNPSKPHVTLLTPLRYDIPPLLRKVPSLRQSPC